MEVSHRSKATAFFEMSKMKNADASTLGWHRPEVKDGRAREAQWGRLCERKANSFSVPC